jgi:1-aminocyclopropane-1-carboxylate deaminase/D-cysteine desulfhydrase-like pyridoxal-dependent ACC family enzyme
LRKALDASELNMSNNAEEVIPNGVTVHSILVLKNKAEQLEFAQRHAANLNLIEGYEFGGYARSTEALDNFVQSLSILNNIPFESIYTGKALFAMNEWLIAQKGMDTLQVDDETGVFPVVFLHTGGTLNYSGVTLPVIDS